MSKFYVAQEGHVVSCLTPQDYDTGKNGVVFSMKKHSHASIITTLGVTAADAGNLTLEECDDITPSNSTAIVFDYYAETTDSGDTLGAKTTATTAGIDVSANDDTIYVIEIDATQLTDGYPYLRVVLSDPAGATFGSVVAVLSGSRYASDQNATAIT